MCGSGNSPRNTISSLSSTPNRSRTAARAPARSAPGCRPPSRAPSLTMKLACVGEMRAPPSARALQARAIDERAGRRRHAHRHAVARRIGILKHAAGARRAPAAASACDTPATRARSARSAAGRRRLTPNSAHSTISPVRCSRLESYANAIRRWAPRARASRRSTSATRRTSIADVRAAEMRVAVDRAADGAGRAGPGLEPGQPAPDRPAHQAVDRDAGLGPHRVRRRSASTPCERAAARRRRARPRPHQHVRAAAKDGDRHARRPRRVPRRARPPRSCTSTSQSAGPPTPKVVSGASGASAWTRPVDDLAQRRCDTAADRIRPSAAQRVAAACRGCRRSRRST